MTALDAALDLAALHGALAEAAALEGIDRDALQRLADKLAQHAFNLVVAGEFKRGKSTVINALLGAPLLPTGVVPLTSVVTLLEYGDTPAATVRFESGEERRIDLDGLADYVTERGNPKNVKGVREVSVATPAAWLKGGLRLVDTPGIGSVHQHNTEVTYHYLPQADAVIFVASVDQPVSRAEMDFLAQIRRHADKLFCLLNKLDYLSESDLAESVAFVTATLHETLGMAVPVFPVSARLALQGRMTNDADAFARSRFAAFDDALQRFLLDEGGTVWAQSVRRNLQRLLAEARLANELELKALAAPLAELEAKLDAFAAKKQETLQAKSDFDALLEADSRRLVRDKIEPDLDAYKGKLLRQLEASLDGWYGELRAQGSAALQSGLEERLIAAVRAGFDAWRADEDAEVGADFERLCGRFWRGIQETIDALLRYSAELFSIPYASIGAEHVWQKRAGFYYKFWEEPPALLMLTDGFVRLLPGALGHPVILRKARQRAADLTDMQAGRLRHDFDERIKKSVRDFRAEMLERIEATIAGIETAIDKGRALRSQGEEVATARRATLEATLSKLHALETRLGAVPPAPTFA